VPTNFLVTYGFGLALITGFAFYQRLRDSQLRSAALGARSCRRTWRRLRMQLSPHTELFNLLHTIRGQITGIRRRPRPWWCSWGTCCGGCSTPATGSSPALDELQFVAL